MYVLQYVISIRMKKKRRKLDPSNFILSKPEQIFEMQKKKNGPLKQEEKKQNKTNVSFCVLASFFQLKIPLFVYYFIIVTIANEENMLVI